MLVFTTKLPLKKEVTQQECLKLLMRWLEGSPHYPANQIDVTLSNQEDYDFSNDDITVSIRHFKDETAELMACRLQNREQNIIWDNDCIYLDNHGKKSLIIQLNCNRKDFSIALPAIHKPRIVKMFVEKGFCDMDGTIPVTDSPIVADEDNYEEYKSIMCGENSCEMPVVYISRDRFGKTVVNPAYLARQLAGVAHVFIEKNYKIASRLKDDTGGNNAYFGYVGIYFPGTKYCQKHGIERYHNRRRMSDGIITDVWDALMNRLDSTQYNWNQILALQARQKMLKMRYVSEQSQGELNEYIETFDEEKRELEEKVEELNRKVLSLRAERDGLLAAKGIKEEEDLFYRAGAEPELYPGERNDLLYSVLSQALKNYAKDTRPYCIITSLLDANPRVGTCEKILKEVKSILRQNNKMSRPVREQLKSLGFSVIEDGPHFKLKFKDPRYMFTVSKTPSDSRSARNLAANICQKIDIEKRI